MRVTAVLEILAGPCLWWLTPLLQGHDPALVAAFRWFQVCFGVAGALTLALFSIRSLGPAMRLWISLANVAVVSAGLGVSCGLAPTPSLIPFHTVPCGF